MVTVTQKYRAAMDTPIREQGYARVEIDVIDPGAAAAITGMADDGHVFYSTLDGIIYDRVSEQTYSTFEPGRWKCDGEGLVPSEGVLHEQGYVGSALSNENGVYTNPPTVRFNFENRRTFPALTLTFDPSHDDWPESVKAIGYRDGPQIIEVTGNPDGPVYELIPAERRGFVNVDRVDVVILAAGKPYRRARLQRIIFGYLWSIEGRKGIESLSCVSESDPISRALPEQSMDLTLSDHEGLYSPDNPVGIWRDMEERIPVRVYFGTRISAGSTWGEVYENYTWAAASRKTWRQLFEGGYYETFLHGTYFLDSNPGTSGRSASFTAVSMLDLLDQEFYQAPVGGGTLFSLATKILESYELPKRADGQENWQLWEGLKSITTSAPLPIATGRELLQSIALMACCAINLDRTGVLHIEPIDATQHDFTLDFQNRQTALPGAEKTAALGGVYSSIFSYTADGEAKELHKGTYTVSAGEVVTVRFSQAASAVRVSGAGTATATPYARAVDIRFAAAGTYDIVVEGRPIEESCSVLADPVEDARPTSAWATFENPLMTDRKQAAVCSAWLKEYLLRRLTYTAETIGFPEVDALDKIYLQSRFTGKLPAWVLRHEVRYTGGFWSNFIAKVDRKE